MFMGRVENYHIFPVRCISKVSVVFKTFLLNYKGKGKSLIEFGTNLTAMIMINYWAKRSDSKFGIDVTIYYMINKG